MCEIKIEKDSNIETEDFSIDAYPDCTSNEETIDSVANFTENSVKSEDCDSFSIKDEFPESIEAVYIKEVVLLCFAL